MAGNPGVDPLLSRVAFRLRVAAVARFAWIATLTAAGLYALLLAVSRFTGLIPDWFSPATVLLAPAAGIAAALFLAPAPTRVEAARRVDRHGGTKDLFLTATLLDESPGEYRPLVLHSARERAASIQPQLVVPFSWRRRATQAAAGLALLLAGTLWLPQWDPFGKVAEAQQQKQFRERLAEERKSVERRIAQLTQAREESESDRELETQVEALKHTFREAQPKAVQVNRERLAEHQKELGEQWKRLKANQLRELFTTKSAAQQFGARNEDMLQKWSEELKKGSTDSLRKQVQAMQDELQRLRKESDPQKREETLQRLRKQLEQMEQFASEKAGSQPLQAALERALDQLELSGLDGLSEEALEALEKSLELSDLELQELAQSAEDLQRLEQALKTLQMAKRLNDAERLDGEQCGACQGLADYEELYQRLMAQLEGGAEGPPGPGIARNDVRGQGGGSVEEDESVATDFTPEQSKSQIVAGKVLLSLKTKGLSESGAARIEFRNELQRVKQGVSEAILQEEVPPGYHEGIKRYFDTIDRQEMPAGRR